MALLVGLAVAVMLAAFEMGIRTGAFERMVSTVPRVAAPSRASFAHIARPLRSEGQRGRAHPGHT